MPNRILKDSICTSETISKLDWISEVFWYRLIIQCDDYGRMDARLAILRARCYPLAMALVSEADIARWLEQFQELGMVHLYEVDGKPYLQIASWDKHQQVRAKRSKYPPMISDDSNGNQMISNAPVIQSNPIQSESNPKLKQEGSVVKQVMPPASPPAPSAGAGRALATKLTVLNGKLPAAQRTPLADEILRICGKAAVAETATDDGDRARYEAHEKAVTLHEMGYKSPAALMEVESFWYDVWPGKKDGERPSFRQLVDTASKLKAGNGRPKEQAVEVYR